MTSNTDFGIVTLPGRHSVDETVENSRRRSAQKESNCSR